MVIKYSAEQIYDDLEHGIECSRVFVLASDYAALEAELADERALTMFVRNELAEANAELARVKSESLRVVEIECQDMSIASDWYMTPDGLGWLGYDRHDCECVETPHGYRKFDECKKVQLEQWENE